MQLRCATAHGAMLTQRKRLLTLGISVQGGELIDAGHAGLRRHRRQRLLRLLVPHRLRWQPPGAVS